MNQIIKDDIEEILSDRLPWDKLQGKNVVITGAAGFIATYLVETLLLLNKKNKTQNTKVIGIVRNIQEARKRFQAHRFRNDLELIEHDISQNPIPFGGKMDFIIHAASQASPKYYGIDPVGTLAPNVFGTQSLLRRAAKDKTEGFLFFSSGEVYGQVSPEQIPTREDVYGFVDPMQVRSCYAESKRIGETIAVSWNHQFGIPTRIVRPFHTYGPGMRLDDGRVFCDFVRNVVNDQDIVMLSDGLAIRPYCYVSDAVRGFFTVLFKGSDATAYNIGNPSAEASVFELANILVALFPEKGLKVLKNQVDRGVNYLQSPILKNSPDISRARALGWSPQYGIEEGFRRTIGSFVE